MKFLIVDDSRAMQHMVIKTLHKAGYKDHLYQVAQNGKQALEVIDQWSPDLVLTDWHMPVMDGITLLRTLKSQGSPVKLGFVTTERSKARVSEALDAGAMFVVSKPFSPAQISEAVVEAISVQAEKAESDTSVAKAVQITMPDLDTIAHLFDDVLHNPPFIVDCPRSHSIIYPHMLGLFEDADHHIRAAIIIDNMLSSLLGAAYSDINVDAAYDSIGAKSLSMDLHDNVEEFLGLCAPLFYNAASETDTGLTFRNSVIVNGNSEKLNAIFNGPGAKRKDYLVDIDGYGCGKISIITL